jgi:salicylate hydroxylase
MPEEIVEPRTTTNCAYRATVPGELMRADPELKKLIEEPYSNCWIGYRRHIMAYPIREGQLYNLVMSHPGTAAVGKWNEPGNLDEMKAHYAGWDPILDKVLDKVKACLKWKLADLPVLSRWVSKSGKVVLIGDAAHAMVPYLAQVSLRDFLSLGGWFKLRSELLSDSGAGTGSKIEWETNREN